jgi:glycerophosphoryl diester phosphodiesterase
MTLSTNDWAERETAKRRIAHRGATSARTAATKENEYWSFTK